MSLPLKDLRFGVSQQTHAILSSYADAHDLQLYEVCQQIVEAWAMKTLHETIVLHDALGKKGALPELAGKPRKPTE